MSGTETETGENEILAEARAHSRKDRRATDRSGDQNWPLVAIGVGAAIGSAALAGAVLYARRRERSGD